MFGKSKKPKNDTPFAVAKNEDAKPVPSPPPAPISSREKSIIGENISIKGQIKGQDHLVIEGMLNGNVELEKHNFTVGLRGRVDGDIRAQNVSISGRLRGTIKALGKVEITKEADFFGKIKAKSIAVEDGAYFKGSIELDREPHRKSNFAASPKGPSTSDAAKTAYSPLTDTKKEA